MKFKWGDAVRTKSSAPEQFRPGEVSSVCGIYFVENEEAALKFGEPIGTVVCLVEFSNGSSIEVPEKWLEQI